ncbi:MAG: TetR/AcrR family transcriptional regulator [bacterium]|nr:TetR/AcrR family transcriptional regulator [bacterium]
MTEHQSQDVRREQILDAAMSLFVEQGYENTSVDEIARSAGLSKGAIYWYFKSKLEILFALTDRNIRNSQNELVQIAAQNDFGPAALYKVHRPLIERRLSTKECNKLFGQLIALGRRYPEISDRIRKYYKDWDDVSKGLLNKAIEDGAFRPVHTLHLAQAISAMYDGLTMRKELDPNLEMVEILETTTKLLYDALTRAGVSALIPEKN